jgi:branched-subunit amino acid aminotransferase/4-amino-4-deoxychorismate lyase
MHKFVSFNRKILSVKDIKINPISSAGLYGKGVFTTIAIYHSKPFLWEKHWRRLNENAERTRIDLSGITALKTSESLAQIIGKNEVFKGRCRITLFDLSSSDIWPVESFTNSGLLIQTGNARQPKQHISITKSSFPINSKSPLAGVKSCNYLENLLAFEEARSNGFDEALRVNEKGHVASACMANIFWLKGDKIFTPSLITGCLAGTTREYILDKWDVFEVEESLNTLDDADLIFLTSAGIGITQVGKYNEKTFIRELNELTTLIKF